MNLTKTSWPGGWQPDFDPVNGDPQGLLRMDNLQLEEMGVLGLVRGLQKLNIPLSAYADRIYSKIFGSNEIIWVGCGNNSSEIIRYNPNGNTTTNLGSGTDHTVFGDCLGNVLITAGAFRVKDNGTKLQNLGLLTPDAPSITAVNQAVLPISGTWALLEGHGMQVVDNAAQTIIDEVSLESITEIVGVFNGGHGDFINTLNIGDGPGLDPGNDTIQFAFTAENAAVITAVSLRFMLDGTDGNIGNNNYYVYSWDINDGNLNLVPGNSGTTVNEDDTYGDMTTSPTTILSAPRSGFTRIGTNQKLDWTTVKYCVWTVQALSMITTQLADLKIVGGVAGNLNGYYNWIQVNLNNNGYYLAKSPASVATTAQTVLNGNVTLTPSASESQVTDIWYFRTSVNNANITNPTSFLDQYYLIAQGKPGVAVQDNTSDIDAIEEDVTLNAFLQSLNYNDVNGLKETIISIEGLYNELMLYLTPSSLYLSDNLNPDAIDSRFTLRVSGDPTESNLWIKKLTNNVLILATNKNLYEISGTLQTLPDGTIDATITPIGEKYPPLTLYCATIPASGDTTIAGSYQSQIAGIAYVAADGVRMTAGSNSFLLNPGMRLWFAGETRQGVPPPIISYQGLYSMAAGKNRLYVVLPLQDGSYRILEYDLIGRTWKYRYTDPTTVFVTQTDRVLLGYNTNDSTTAGYIFELDKLTGVSDTDGTLLEGLPFTFQTVYDANQQPRNRKDTFTLKLIADTGGDDCSVYIDWDNSGTSPNWKYVGNLNSNGLTTSYYDVSQYTLGFRYAFKIVDKNYVTTFKLYELTLEYEPRPEQLNYLRLLADNLGTIARKRITNYAFIIDTLGQDVVFTPYIDNSNHGLLPSSIVVNTPTKQTVILYFTSEQIGTDVGGVFSGNVFEFYGVANQEVISEKMPVPVEYLVIPANDYGKPNRKRHTSYKFQINTRGKNVLFTPFIDGLDYYAPLLVDYTPLVVNTSLKQTVEYFFDTSLGDVTGKDIGGTLDSLEGTPFEFYGVITPQEIEVLPARLESFRIPDSNFGVPSLKRIRTIPIIINTNGETVRFTPIVDGTSLDSTSLNCFGKRTLYHYFKDDVFGTDYGGLLISDGGPFEFYELGQPLDVEALPTPRMFDQIGPIRFDKIGKVFSLRIRMITQESNIPFALIGKQITIPQNGFSNYEGMIIANPYMDDVYQIELPHSVNVDVLRIVIGPTQFPFFRYDCQIRVTESGMETDSEWKNV